MDYATMRRYAVAVYYRAGLHKLDPSYEVDDLMHDAYLRTGTDMDVPGYYSQSLRGVASNRHRSRRAKSSVPRAASLSAPLTDDNALTLEGTVADPHQSDDMLLSAFTLNAIMRTRVGRICVAKAIGHDENEIAEIFGMSALDVVRLLETIKWVDGACTRVCFTCNQRPLEPDSIYCAQCAPKPPPVREPRRTTRRGIKNPRYTKP